MILTKYVKVNIMNKQQYDYFNSIGYKVEYRDKIEIPIEDLSTGASLKIDVKCDICGKEKKLSYQKYNKNIRKYNIYSCSEKCAQVKNRKTCLEKYGVENPTLMVSNPELYLKKQKTINIKKKIRRIILNINGEKICIKCGEIKTLSNFSKRKGSSDGYFNICKLCKNKRRKDVYDTKKDVLLPLYRERKRKYIENNRKDVNKQQRNYYHNKFKHTNKHKFLWRQILASTLRRMNTQKTDKTINLLGYSATDLKEHITSLFTKGMTWENHGEWHVDHIKPVSSFDDDTPVSIVCSLDNLQPLWATTREIDGIIYEGNLNKGDNYE